MSYDALTSVAEIAITMAGFAGLASVFKAQGKLGSEEIRRVIYLVAVSVTVVVTALMPAVISGMGFSDTVALEISCAALGLASIVFATNAMFSVVRSVITPLYPKTTYLLITLIFCQGGAQLIAVSTELLGASVGLLLAGHVVLLLLSVWIFVTTIVWAKDV